VKNHKRVLSLKPTQFAVGILEVQEKIEEMKKLDSRQLRKFVKQTPIPVVTAPTNDFDSVLVFYA
jgi:hypothetical protein